LEIWHLIFEINNLSMLTIIIFFLVLGVLVLVHELGHFLSARYFGVKAEEFGFGFPPRIFGIYKKANGRWVRVWGDKKVSDAIGTVYSFNWIPLGGFVKIKGENGDVKDTDSFSVKKIWQRAVILSAGVIMNIFLAGFIITVGLMVGLPQILEDLPDQVKIKSSMIQIVDVMPNSPASQADFKIGDILIDIDNQTFENYPQVQTFVNEHNGQNLVYTIKRGQDLIDKEVTPTTIKETGKGGIGIGIAQVGLVRYPWYLAIVEGFKSTFLLLWAIIIGFFSLLARVFSGQSVSAEVAGPVGIATLTGQMVAMGWVYVMQFTAMLSLNLAVINILPIPALDGGRLLFLVIEKIKGKPVKQEIEAMIHNIFFILLLLLILLITFKDVSRLGCLSCRLSNLFKL